MKRKEKEFDYLDDDYVQVNYRLIGARELLELMALWSNIMFQLYLTQNITIGDIVYTAADPSAK